MEANIEARPGRNAAEPVMRYNDSTQDSAHINIDQFHQNYHNHSPGMCDNKLLSWNVFIRLKKHLRTELEPFLRHQVFFILYNCFFCSTRVKHTDDLNNQKINDELRPATYPEESKIPQPKRFQNVRKYLDTPSSESNTPDKMENDVRWVKV